MGERFTFPPQMLNPRYAYAHAADPEYSLRESSLRQPSFETLFCRPYLIEIPGTHRHPRDPGRAKVTQGDPKGPKGTQEDPRGPKGTQGRLRRPWGGRAHGTLWGHSEVIPNGMPFRIESHSEWKSFRIKQSTCEGFGLKRRPQEASRNDLKKLQEMISRSLRK